jgi:hypothetical protein
VSLPFDATLKELIGTFAGDYVHALGLDEFNPLTPLNVDLSTVSAATDVVLGQGDPPSRVLDLNLQSGPDSGLHARVMMYHAVLHYHYLVPVHSVIVLLRPEADHANLTGRLHYVGKARKGKMDFSYEVVRLWREPVKRFLTAGVGALPLAPLCKLPGGRRAADALGPVIRRIDERLTQEAAPDVRAHLLAATYVLCGLRVSPEVATPLFQGILDMKESSTYQAILNEGAIGSLQKTLLILGKQRFGQPQQAVEHAIRGLSDRQRLERMVEKLDGCSTWEELLRKK